MNSHTSLFLNFPCPVNRTTVKRLLWLDVAKGLAILVVVYFHFFRTYFEHGSLPPADWSSLATGLTTFLPLAWLKLSGLGFRARRGCV